MFVHDLNPHTLPLEEYLSLRLETYAIVDRIKVYNPLQGKMPVEGCFFGEVIPNRSIMRLTAIGSIMLHGGDVLPAQMDAQLTTHRVNNFLRHLTFRSPKLPTVDAIIDVAWQDDIEPVDAHVNNY